MAQFWNDFGKIVGMAFTDKILVGRNSDGNTMYADMQQFYDKISQSNFADVKPSFVSAGASLGTPTKLTVYYAPAGSYTTPSGTITLTADLSLLFWNLTGWSYLELLNLGVEISVGKNIFDKATKYAPGQGVGTDGNFFPLANCGSAVGVPVTAGTNIVVSGCASFRGLRFEDSTGAKLSYVGSPTQNTPYNVPAGCTRISFQIHLHTTPPLDANAVQVEVGTVATAYEAYQQRVTKVRGITIKNADKEVYTQAQIDTFNTTLNALIGINSTNITALQAGLTKINVVKTQVDAIIPDPSLNYTYYNLNQYSEISSWFVAKSVKTPKRLGVFIFKHTSTGSFTHPVRIQVIHKRGSTSTVLLNTTLSAASLAANNTTGIVGSYNNYLKVLDLTTFMTLQVSDTFFVSVQSEDKLYPIYSSANALLSTGEWNDGTTCYRNWNPTFSTSQTIYSTIPSLPAGNSNYNVVNFYDTVDTTLDLPVLISTIQTVLATKAAVTTTLVKVGTNIFDKATMYFSGQGIGTDGNFFTLLNCGCAIGVPVTAGRNVVISGCASFRGLRFEDSTGAKLSYVGSPTQNTPYTVPAGCTRISFQIHLNTTPPLDANAVQVEVGLVATAYEAYSATTYVKEIDGKMIYAEVSKNSEATALDFEVLAPSTVYFANSPTLAGRKTAVLMFLQRFIRDKKELWLNKSQNQVILSKYNLNPDGVNVIQENVSFSVDGAGYASKIVNINRVSTNASVMANFSVESDFVSDSTGENRMKNGVTVGAGAFWSMALENARKYRYDNGGTGYNWRCNGRNLFGVDSTIPYRSGTINVKGYCEAQGGYSAFGYLRHPFRMWVYFQAGAWDLLGLATTIGRAYDPNNANDKLLIATTCWGVNTPVVSANAYNLLKEEKQIADLGTWTNSTAQNNAVQGYIDGIANGTKTPENPFFDYGKSGANRFSIAKYIERYKTLDADGNRLVQGSTAGTEIGKFDKNGNLMTVNSFDITTKARTHVGICLGENDRLWYYNYVQICNDIFEIAAEYKAYYSSIWVGISLTGIPSPMFPERNDKYYSKFYQDHHNRKFDLCKELYSRFGSLASQVTNRIFILPTYHTGTPLSNSITSEQVDETQPNSTIQVGIDDYNHPGYYGMRSAGQYWEWAAYTSTL